MNPHANRSISPFEFWRSLMTNHNLVMGLIKREIIGRYRGSVMGLLWSFFNPVLMLAIYTFVFSVVFKSRWVGGSDSKTEFALVLFAGLLVFNLFAECLNRAPGLILSNVNYVKKVIFPIELLPVIALGTAAFHFLVSLLVWILFFCVFFGVPSPTILWLPIVLIPLVLITLGFSWLLASLGVFIRDISHVVGITITILMFLSPIFYPVSVLPVKYQLFMKLNPLTFVVEQVRDVMIFHRPLNGFSWLIHFLLSALVAWIGFAWFQKTRKGFADVL